MASGTDRKLRGKAAFICQRVSPIKGVVLWLESRPPQSLYNGDLPMKTGNWSIAKGHA
jgi:hypothetical protein